jgi:hypothetical protein
MGVNFLQPCCIIWVKHVERLCARAEKLVRKRQGGEGASINTRRFFVFAPGFSYRAVGYTIVSDAFAARDGSPLMNSGFIVRMASTESSPTVTCASA